MAQSLSPSVEELLETCHCVAWAKGLASIAPFNGFGDLIRAARLIWWHETPVTGWLEAFAAHPRIGDIEGLRAKFGAFAAHSKGEQSAATGASDETLHELALWNKRYEAKFGHIFIVCATGKAADEMLAIVKARFPNDPATELKNAAIEQMKITELRLAKIPLVALPNTPAARRTEKMLDQLSPKSRPDPTPAPPTGALRSPITTHVLDTSVGRPAEGVAVELGRLAPGSSGSWEVVGRGVTNRDGRVGDLLAPSDTVQPGTYRIRFATGEYAARVRQRHPDFFAPLPFYPSASVEFNIAPDQARTHFHVPLTYNPYGYSTYRGS